MQNFRLGIEPADFSEFQLYFNVKKFCKITLRRFKYCLEMSKARLKISA